MKMKRYAACSLTLIASLTASLLAGCGGNASSASVSGESGVVETLSSDGMGRYVESEIGNPFQSEDTEIETQTETEISDGGITDYSSSYILNMAVLSDKTLRAVVAQSDGSYKIYKSEDNGNTWSDTGADFSSIGGFYSSKESDDGKTISTSLSCPSFDSSGDLFFIYETYSYDENESIDEQKYYLMTADGKISEMDFTVPDVDKLTNYDTQVETYMEEETEEQDDGITINDENASDEDIEISDSGETTSETGGEDVTTMSIQNVKLVDKDKVYVVTDSACYLISMKEDKVLKEMKDLEYTSQAVVCGDTLILSDYETAYQYNLEDGEKLSETKGIAKILSSARSMVSFADNLLEKKLYYCSSDGIFQYDFDSGNSVQILDGNLSSLVDPNITVNSLVACADGSFLAELSNAATTSLYSYVYDKDVKARPDQEITVYMLTDDYDMRQAAAGYQKANPDVYISYEIGMTGEDAMTSSDAIKTLNTEIMSGEGPDVILMNGLNADDYIEKGVLLDLSDIVDSGVKDGSLFENIVTAFENDGKISIVPLEFTYPMIVGKKDTVGKIASISDYADAAENFLKTRKDENEEFMDLFSVSSLLTTFLPVCTTWYKEDGTLDEEELKTQLEDIKRLYEASKKALTEENRSYLDEMNEYYRSSSSESSDTLDITTASLGSDPAMNAADILSGTECTTCGYFYMLSSLEYLTSAMRIDKDITYKSLPGSGGKSFVPYEMVGVNAKAKDTDAAKAFVQYLLGEEAQNLLGQSMLPVNIQAFEKQLKLPENTSETDTMYGMNDNGEDSQGFVMHWPSEEEKQDFIGSAKDLDTCAFANNTIMNTIYEDSLPYILGDSSLDDVVSKIQDDIKIYLAE